MTDVEESPLPDPKASKSKSTPLKVFDFVLWFVKDQWFLIGIIFVIIVSSQVQVPESQQATKQVVVSYLSGMRSRLILFCDFTDNRSLPDILRHGLYTRYQDPFEQLCKMEASHLYSSSMLSHGLGSRFCHCQSYCHQQVLHGFLAFDRSDL